MFFIRLIMRSNQVRKSCKIPYNRWKRDNLLQACPASFKLVSRELLRVRMLGRHQTCFPRDVNDWGEDKILSSYRNISGDRDGSLSWSPGLSSSLLVSPPLLIHRNDEEPEDNIAYLLATSQNKDTRRLPKKQLHRKCLTCQVPQVSKSFEKQHAKRAHIKLSSTWRKISG